MGETVATLGYARQVGAGLHMERGEDSAVQVVIPVVGAAGRTVWSIFGALFFALVAVMATTDALLAWVGMPVAGLVAAAFAFDAVRAWRERAKAVVIDADRTGLAIAVPWGGKIERKMMRREEVEQVWVVEVGDRVGGRPAWFMHVACVGGKHRRVGFAVEGGGRGGGGGAAGDGVAGEGREAAGAGGG